MPGWGARFHHPTQNMSAYGREISSDVSAGALMLHTNLTNAQKETLLIRYVQTGIDLYGIVNNGGYRNWSPDGGHASGRKWPILFAGLVLNDSAMQNIGALSGDYLYSGSYGPGNRPPDYIEFGEDGQTFYVTQDDIDLVHDPDTRNCPAVSYSASNLNMPEWGIRHSSYPTYDNNHWLAIYRQCCTAHAWNGFVLSALIMNTKTLWNHDALFDYTDRYMAITNGDPDPFGYSVDGETSGWRSTSTWTAAMWDAYRSSY
jgi:hypothetical protein